MPVTVYIVVINGDAITVAPVVALSPVVGAHEYALAPFALKDTLPDAQIVAEDGTGFIVTTGNGFTAILPLDEHVLPQASVIVTV